MLTFVAVFGLLVSIIAVIGAMRGGAKELINTFGIVLALFMYDLLMNVTDFVRNFLDRMVEADPIAGRRTEFGALAVLFLIVVLFAYMGPTAARMVSARAVVKRSETVFDAITGLFVGLINGYLIVGTVWYFLVITNYPFPDSVMVQPLAGTTSASVVQFLPLVWLTPYLKFLLPVAALLMLVMFI